MRDSLDRRIEAPRGKRPVKSSARAIAEAIEPLSR